MSYKLTQCHRVTSLGLLSTLTSACLSLVGCGGSSSSESPVSISGTAAYGTAYPMGSVVVVQDATGATVGTGQVSDASGTYSVAVPASAQVPLVLSASADDLPTLVSVATELKAATVNVTPLTNLIAAGLSSSGDPTQLAAEIKSKSATVTSDSLKASKDAVVAYLQPIIGASLSDTTDPISGSFKADGTGHDQVLDAIKISISNTGQVALTVAQAGVPVEKSFQASASALSSSLASDSNKLSAVSKDDLPKAGLSTQIVALATRMNDCFALATADRVNAGANAATDIKDGACKSMFYGSDPSLFKHNSDTINSLGAFKEIYASNSAATNIKFSLPTYEYTVKNGNTADATKPMNGDLVLTMKKTDGDGNTSIEELWARPDSEGTAIGLIGNLSGIDADVSPRVELREFTHADMRTKSYYNTGYSVFVNSKHPFAKIVVTTPTGKALTLTKKSGFDYYVLTTKNGTQLPTSVIRLAAQYVDPSTTGTPRSFDTTAFWATAPDGSDKDWSDADIAALGNQGTWVFDLYTRATDSAPAITTKRRTLRRAPTLAETKAAKWPSLTDTFRQAVATESATDGFITLSQGDTAGISADGVSDAWSVPSGAWSP